MIDLYAPLLKGHQALTPFHCMDGNVRGELQCLKPKFIPICQERNRRSKRISEYPKHCYQFATQTKASSLKNFERSFRGRIPQIWNELNDEALFQENTIKSQKYMTSSEHKLFE